jgi:preprotein translocase subunit SecF
MLNIIDKKNWYYLLSLLVIVPGVVSLLLYGLNLSIDFTGGTRIAYQFKKPVDSKIIQAISSTYNEENISIATIQPSSQEVFIRTAPINEKKNASITQKLQKKIGNFKQESFETIGPTIGAETTQKAFYSVLISSALILVYIAISFRKVPKPTSSWRFGVATIVALLHDVLVLVGIFSILGHFFRVEIDSLFITALMTVMGFSVHDTIVVFDRVRENLQKIGGLSFEQVVNESILQTFVRSLNTSLTALLVLFALLLFGGESVRWFVAALLIGIASGTYSSIFNAAPLLVSWHDFDERRKIKNK